MEEHDFGGRDRRERAELRRRLDALELDLAGRDRSIRHLTTTIVEWIEAAQRRGR